MSHDFAKKPKTEGRSASRKPTKPKTPIPGWVWLLTGLVTGIFISFLVFLADITPKKAPANKTVKQSNSEPQSKDSGPRFDFYTLLPEREVIIPKEEVQSHSQPVPQYQYTLQAGSFRHAKDADRLRAKLIMLGMDVEVDSVKGREGATWHRVRVGPFTSRSKMSKARSKLVDLGIMPLKIKQPLKG